MASHRTYNILCLVFALMVIASMAAADEKDQSAESGVIDLDEVIVSATRRPANLDDISVSSSIMTEKQIDSSTANALGSLLESSNILQISEYGAGSLSTAAMRGSSYQQVLVLVDGERINDSLSGGTNLNNVSAANIERIEVIRGGQSAMYGADAVGGIINIITKKPTRASARAWSTLGAYELVSWGLEASRKIKTVSGLVSFSRTDSKSDFPFEDKFHEELIRENADFMKRNLFGKLEWNISNSMSLKLSGNHYYADRGEPGLIGQYTPEAIKRDKSNDVRAEFQQSLTAGTLYKLFASKRDTTLRYINPEGPYPANDTHKSGSLGTEFQLHLLQDSAFPLIFGASLRNEGIDSTTVGDRKRETYSGYFQQELGRNFDGEFIDLRRIAIFPSVRWDHYSDFDAGISPKVGFLASFGTNYTIAAKANVGRSYRAPTLNDLYWPADAFAVGNPDLGSETSVNADAGINLHIVEQSMIPVLSEMRCGVTYFWNSFHDRIQWNPGASGKWSPQNVSEAKSRGIEAEMTLSVLRNLLTLGGNYTFQKTEDALERQLLYQPKHSLGYSLRIGTESLWGQVQGLYRSRRYYTLQNTKWLDPFMKFDVQMGFERRLWNGTNLGFVLEIKNVLDEKYQLVADYPLPGREWAFKTVIGMKGE